MNLKPAFETSKNVRDLSAAWIKGLAKVPAVTPELAKQLTVEGAVSLVAPGAMLAKAIQLEALDTTSKALKVLFFCQDTISIMDGGRWINLAADFLELGHGLELFSIGHTEFKSSGEPLAQCLGLKPLQVISAADAENLHWDMVIWVHPKLEGREDQHLANLAASLHAGGVPVYGVMYNELDAVTQSYCMSPTGYMFEWIDAPMHIADMSERSVNRHGISLNGMGIEGGWGAVITRLGSAAITPSALEVEAVATAAVLESLLGIQGGNWSFGATVPGVRFGKVVPVGLHGNVAVDPQRGVLYKHCHLTGTLKQVGHLPQDETAYPPCLKFHLVPWSARLYLLALYEVPREDGKHRQVLELLNKSSEAGLVEGGIALARAHELSGTSSSTHAANQIYESLSTSHYMAAYAIAHQRLEEGQYSAAVPLFLVAADAGYPAAISDLGVLMIENERTSIGVSLLMEAAGLGDAEASFRLGEHKLSQSLFNDALGHLRDAWSHGHVQALEVAEWLCNEMLAQGLGSRGKLKRELKDIDAFNRKLERYRQEEIG